ncbi:ketoacyl-ACP synthase III family protein [Phytohabitans houttuyneae]|uniref:Beta-ketoacyl-[acyl-carrier-protein] synthase III C-terminal domain-containing protein n=1 Tax=Phytohabitans houttuyneae TaxID=1076126 RepID=A0A6V8KEK8_9ACTN|nr:ketoacyl-ACP synthase III family protein [Phytohabitans houttuyneae]GFJ80768.1 hypothetical protein Phou_049480 [Phytohabitans houttuyneae]
MRVGDVYLSGLGVVLPGRESVLSAVERGLLTAEQAEVLEFESAAVAGEESAPEMALRAAQDALKTSGVAPSELDALLYANVWHQGPEGWGPQTYLQHHLLGDDLLAVELKQGCNGVFTGMELSVGVLRAEPSRRATIVLASDNFGTPIMERWMPGTGLVILGDAASATVLTKAPGFAQLLSIHTSALSGMEEAYRAGEPLFPPGITVGRRLDFVGRLEAYKAKAVADGSGWVLALQHNQRYVDCIRRALADADVDASEIKRVVVHNLARAEVELYLGVLGIPLARTTWGFGRKIGHLGSSDHLVSLYQLIATGQVAPGDAVLMCGYASGVTYKAAVLRILDVPSWATETGGLDLD